MDPGETYVASVYVKVENDTDVKIRAYTADNVEEGRQYAIYNHVPPGADWTRLQWSIENPADSQAESLSFNYHGLKTGRMWLCAPQLERASIVYGASSFRHGGITWNAATSDGPCAAGKKWLGVTCDRGGRVVKLDLRERGLWGTIPKSIEVLQKLTAL